MSNTHVRRPTAVQLPSGQVASSDTRSKSASHGHFRRGGQRHRAAIAGQVERGRRLPFTGDDRAYQNYIRAIRKNWYIVVVVFVLALIGAALVTMKTPNLYATKMTFFVKTPSGQLDSALQGDAFGQKRVNSYIKLATTDRLLRPVLEDTHLDMTTEALATEIAASGDPDTVLLTVIVTDPSSERSLALAHSISTEFVKAVTDLESASTGPDSAVGLELVSGPSLDLTPVSPRPLMNFGLAALAGLIAGVGMALLRTVLDTTIRSPETLETVTGAAVIGVIPSDDTAVRHPLAAESGTSMYAEAFRVLRTNLEFVDVDTPAKSLIITSAVTEEGKSRTVISLALAFADAGKQVLLIDANLRQPRVAEYLGFGSAVGLTNVLARQVAVLDIVRPWGRTGLKVLPSGSIAPNPSELLGSKNMKTLLDTMTQKFDVVLIDAPALLPVTDAAVMAAHADGTLLVVRCGSATRRQVAMAAGALQKVHSHVIGSVLNCAPTRADDAHGYTEVPSVGETAPANEAGRSTVDVSRAWAGGPQLRPSGEATNGTAANAPQAPIVRPPAAQVVQRSDTR